MPESSAPAALRTLDTAGLTVRQVDAIASRNTLAVNDIVVARETGAAWPR